MKKRKLLPMPGRGQQRAIRTVGPLRHAVYMALTQRNSGFIEWAGMCYKQVGAMNKPEMIARIERLAKRHELVLH